MTDDIDDAPGPTGPSRRRAVTMAAAVGVAGLVAGGLSAGALAAASADAGTSGPGGGMHGYGVRPPCGSGPCDGDSGGRPAAPPTRAPATS